MTLQLPHGFTSLQDVDDAYDPFRRAVDGARSNRHLEERGAEARSRFPCQLGIPYGPTRAETLDIFPAERPDAPVFFFLHGGYWRARSASGYHSVVFGPRALGFTSVVVDYALCPTVTLDEIVRQVRAAAAWTLRHIAEYGGDPRRIVVSGHSAGGHLGAMLLNTPWARDYDLPDDPFVGALLVSGLYDIAPLQFSYLQPALQFDAGLVQRNSPVHHARACRTPMHLSWGELEQPAFAQQSQAMHAAWQQAGNASELAPQPDCDHFTVLEGLERPDSALCAALRRYAGV